MLEPHRSDMSLEGLVKTRALIRTRRHRRSESGQATVEFALILFPLLTVVAGIIYFGIGLNQWLDMNRVANQGARFAVVNNWPNQCPRDTTPGYSCSTSTSSTPCSTVLATGSKADLQDVLRCQVRNNPTVTICYPGETALTVTVGDPVKVKLTAPYTFFFMDRVGITLTASATMRLEQLPSLITNGGGPAC